MTAIEVDGKQSNEKEEETASIESDDLEERRRGRNMR